MEINNLLSRVSQVSILPIEDIQIHSEVIPFIREKKINHIKYTMNRFGQQMPVLGNFVDGKFYITDGVVRFEIAKLLGWDTLKCLDISIPNKDVVKLRMTSNQRTKMTYMEMATYAEHTLGVLGKSQGKKRDGWLGMDDIDNDDNYGLAGKDRFELTCHLLDLPIKSSSLRKLMVLKQFEDENPDNNIGIMAGLDKGLFRIDKIYQLLGLRINNEGQLEVRKGGEYAVNIDMGDITSELNYKDKLNQELLEQAKDKYESKNDIKDHYYYKDSMEDFILRMFIHCDPSSYGKKFVKKILRDHKSDDKGVTLYSVFDKTDRGDIALSYPEPNYFTGRFYDPREFRELDYQTEVFKKWAEVKISYLGKNDTFTIRNIRPYQDFDYYLLCFVDCKDNFKPCFILVSKDVITNNPVFTLTPMNGTKNANKDNKDIGYGMTVKRNGDNFFYLTEITNLLEGTTYQDVTNFFIRENEKLKRHFNKTVPVIDNSNSYIGG